MHLIIELICYTSLTFPWCTGGFWFVLATSLKWKMSLVHFGVGRFVKANFNILENCSKAQFQIMALHLYIMDLNNSKTPYMLEQDCKALGEIS